MALYSQSCGYALLALTRLVESESIPMSAKEIADSYGVSTGSISQALFQLKRAQIVKGKRGKSGGFVLVSDPESLSLMDVVIAMGCEHDLPCCLFGLNEELALAHCPTLQFWVDERERIANMLSGTLVKDLHILSKKAPGDAAAKNPIRGCDQILSDSKAVTVSGVPLD